jgi:S-adenosylmethionine hydrolase
LEAVGANVEITIGSERIAGLQPSYAQAPPQAVLAAINSFEVLEIAVNQGNASEQLQAGAGTPVRVDISAGG